MVKQQIDLDANASVVVGIRAPMRWKLAIAMAGSRAGISGSDFVRKATEGDVIHRIRAATDKGKRAERLMALQARLRELDPAAVDTIPVDELLREQEEAVAELETWIPVAETFRGDSP